MVQHTILMPFNRPQHFQTLREGMEGQGVTWVPLYDSDECHALFRNTKAAVPEWIKPWRGDLPKDWSYRTLTDGQGHMIHELDKSKPKQPTVNPGHWMCDAFLDYNANHDEKVEQPVHRFFRPDHYVSFMTDDCYWAWNHWRKLQRHFVKRGPKDQEYGPHVIMCATMLGSNVVEAKHRRSSDPFYVSSCRTFATRFEALTVRADLLKEPRFGSFWAGDGIMVERLVEENIGKMPESVTFANDAVVFFNGLRPEVWGFPESHQR